MQYFFGNQNCCKKIPMGKHPQGPWVWPHTSSQGSEVKEHRKPALLLLLLTFIKPGVKAPSLTLRFLLITGEGSYFSTSPQSEGRVQVILWHLAPKEGPALGGKRNLRKNPGLDVRTAQPCSQRTHRTSDKEHCS